MQDIQFENLCNMFGQEDLAPEQLILKMTLNMPLFNEKTILSFFKTIIKNYHGSDDQKIPEHEYANRYYKGLSVSKIMDLEAERDHSNDYYSDIIFRNLMRLILNTEFLDQIIKRKHFQRSFKKLLEDVTKLFMKNYRSNSMSRLYEIMCEFSEKIKEKTS